ncbi:hypothetical protein L249_7237 [Ophiocordyceps polyrhachis-furcata BCC 54312]|uniref:Mannosyltransferase n=1 Tax=Ophiocordyceps polyrhachis-furcata BCC 54312 TaxID=1330021 RepID=A0A367LB59_9HYPO|nr:hypothetical protein L249_7237 [Ophiocordyceps polyrhachis-furcata BCC 54312]
MPLLHLVLSPYTKVEESFNLQATHDILIYGTPSSSPASRLSSTYDHFSFPGAVPRTFVGPVLLAGVAQPLLAVLGFRHAQFVVRALLGFFNASALLVFRTRLSAAFGSGVGRWWTFLIVSQFHVAYYLSRTLPNMFAFGMTTLALAFLLPYPDPHRGQIRQKQSVGILVLATAIFRSELAILLSVVGLWLLLRGHTTLRRLVVVVVVTLVAALLMSVPVDSYFWQKPLWPELWGFYFNVLLGSSSAWGVSPWHYYFSSALPRLLLNPLAIPLIVLALVQPGTRRQAVGLVVPSLLYVALYSLQPHKEVRFIFYVVPPLTAAAALGADFVSTRRTKSATHGLATLLLVLSVFATAAASVAMLLLSSLSYPGGDALSQLHDLVARSADSFPSSSSSPSTITVHADVLTCMTGLTLFGQNRDGLPLALGLPPPPPPPHPHPTTTTTTTTPLLLFDKTEDAPLLDRPSFWERMDYALMEDPAAALGNWQVIAAVLAYDGIEMLGPKTSSSSSSPSPNPPQPPHRVVGLGARVIRLRESVRSLTGGRWLGPRMKPRIYIMRRVTRRPRYATA